MATGAHNDPGSFRSLNLHIDAKVERLKHLYPEGSGLLLGK